MIRNEHERRVATRKLAELADTLDARTDAPMPAGRVAEMHELVTEGIRSQIGELRHELDTYTQLASGSIDVALPNLELLGEQLVKARVAAGMSQQQLADAAGVAEGVIRRYERDNYNGASLHRLQLIQRTLDAGAISPERDIEYPGDRAANARTSLRSETTERAS